MFFMMLEGMVIDPLLRVLPEDNHSFSPFIVLCDQYQQPTKKLARYEVTGIPLPANLKSLGKPASVCNFTG